MSREMPPDHRVMDLGFRVLGFRRVETLTCAAYLDEEVAEGDAAGPQDLGLKV